MKIFFEPVRHIDFHIGFAIFFLCAYVVKKAYISGIPKTKIKHMFKQFLGTAVIFSMIALLSCGSKKESAASIAQKWCDLNAKAYNATDETAKTAAEKARDDFENEMEAKYKNDEAFMKEIETEVEKCEDASEGRK